MTLCTLFAAAGIGGVFPLLCTPYAKLMGTHPAKPL